MKKPDTYFARLNCDDIVIRVIVVAEEDCIAPKAWWDPLGFVTGKRSEQVGISFCQNLVYSDHPYSVWKEVDKHSRGVCSKGFRGNFPSTGYIYLKGVRTLGVASTDIFIDRQPFPSWSIGINTAHWYPPYERPELTQFENDKMMEYFWDEESYTLNKNNGWVLLSPKEKELYWTKKVEEQREYISKLSRW